LSTPLDGTKYDAILFDFDGVLADTEPVHYECWKEILEPFGITFDWQFYQQNCVGISDRTMVERFAAERVPPLPMEEVLPAYHSKIDMFRSKIEAMPPFLNETLELVRDLSVKYKLKLGVVSSSGRSEVELPIERAGMKQYFQAFVCGKEVENLKPAPDPYLRGAELLEARRPLVVEDSDAGIASGLAAGFDVLRVSSPAAVAREVRLKLDSGNN